MTLPRSRTGQSSPVLLLPSVAKACNDQVVATSLKNHFLYSSPAALNIVLRALVTCTILTLSSFSSADISFGVWGPSNNAPFFKTAPEACDHLFYVQFPIYLGSYSPAASIYMDEDNYWCGMPGMPGGTWGSAVRTWFSCPDNSVGVDPWKRGCLASSDLGVPADNRALGSCAVMPGSLVGNPINLTNGNKYQTEYIFDSDKFKDTYLTYNSIDGAWRHSFSTTLTPEKGFILITEADGGAKIFKNIGGVYTGSATGQVFQTTDGWLYRDSFNFQFYFSPEGELVKTVDANGHSQSIAHDRSNTVIQISVKDDFGRLVKVTTNLSGQVISLLADGEKAEVKYDTNGRLVAIINNKSGNITKRYFLYENTALPNALTGTIDARGIRFASWEYDSIGRAVSSQHAGVHKVLLAFDSDTSTTVTNELGRQTIYRFNTIQGVRRIVSIEGSITESCPASNSSYTYTDRGLLLTKTDAKGFITTYTYNDRGLETTRTEASGTPQARVTTTEWDPTRFLRTKVVEPTRTTVYTYDDQGRETGRQVSAR